ncbi:MAG: PKD domain-containing protein [Flavobacteriales bacterium]|nr:PKD domain-containing protein [Flavobacteriales bacterium]
MKIYKLLLLFFLFPFTGMFQADAQRVNLAPSATATAYTPDPNGLWNWYGINNGVNNACNSQEAFIWTSSYGKPNGTEYMQFEWSTPKTLKGITFVNANQSSRNMTGATLQYWNGSTYVDWAKFTIAQACEDSTFFSPVTSAKFRITKMEMNGSGQQSNPNWREVMLWQGSTKQDDASIVGIETPLCSPVLKVQFFNQGTNTVDSCKINWSVNGSLQPQMNYTKSHAKATGSTVQLTPDYNFVDGGNYTVMAWTSLPNGRQDSVPSNDTAILKFRYLGPAGTPVGKDVIKCGPGRAPLAASTGFAGDSIVWYDDPSKGKIIARGKNTLSPPLVLGVNTFYAQAFKIGTPSSINKSGGTTILSANFGDYNGGMIDITPQADIVLDSVAIRFYQNYTGSTYEVYYRVGSYQGNETNSAAWTLLSTGSTTPGAGNFGVLRLPETPLAANVTYGFYVTTTPTVGNDLYASSGYSTYSNADVSIYGGAFIYGRWASNGIYAPYHIDFTTYYRKASCPSPRVPIKVTVKPSPAGAAFIKGSPFTSPVPNSNGFKGNPDIVASGDQLTYEVTPPTGYSNSGHKSTWVTNNLTFRTEGGRTLSSSYYSYTEPSGAGNGIVTFTPDAGLTDTTIIMTLHLEDLGPHFCDSMLTRYIFVAPRPVPDFSFNQPVCDGDAVVFDNLTTISSGGVKYFWDFGTGNPADTSDAYTTVFTFPTYGVYDVTLTTTSLPFGYVVKKTIKVVVTEIPNIDFKVVNACEKVPVSFVNNTTHSSTVAYSWDFGDPSTTADKSTAKSPTWTYTNPGGYKVTLKATANGCTSELTKNANQFATPKANYTAPTLICDNVPVQMKNASTIKFGNMGYTWFVDGSNISNFANPEITFANTASKTVKMKAVSEFGCQDSVIKNITPLESPLANFSWNAACNLTATDFNFTGKKPASPVLTTFDWNFNNEGNTTLENPSKLFSNVGPKMVTLNMVSNNGCSNSITKTVDVKLQSKADFSSADVCENDDAVFTNKSAVSAGNLDFNWKFGDGSTSASQSPRHRYNISGVSQTYNVTLVALVPGGCSDSVTKSVTINANPDAGFTYTKSGRLVYFTANSPGATLYQWRFGDGSSSTQANPQYNYIEYPEATYTACLAVVNAAGCFSETCQKISVGLGIDKLSKLTGYKLYPNPNNGSFNITVEEPKSDIAIAVYNMLGELVQNVETSSLKSSYEINLNSASGVYLVKITNGGLVATQKITVNK